jgi:hypothetical protein
MLRFLGFATLIMVAACLVLGASIALASASAEPADERTIEAIDPDRRMVDSSLAAIAPDMDCERPSRRPDL